MPFLLGAPFLIDLASSAWLLRQVSCDGVGRHYRRGSNVLMVKPSSPPALQLSSSPVPVPVGRKGPERYIDEYSRMRSCRIDRHRQCRNVLGKTTTGKRMTIKGATESWGCLCTVSLFGDSVAKDLFPAGVLFSRIWSPGQ